MKHIPYILFLMAFIVAGCTESEPLIETGTDEPVALSFTMNGTRAGNTSSTTYRAMLHRANGNPGTYPYTEISGTYRGPNTDERAWLTACETDSATGVWQQDGHLYGLRATRDNYYLSFVSPAVKPQGYQYNAKTKKFEKWAFIHHRQPQPGEPELFISSPYKISLAGNHINGKYVHDVPDSVILKERRAKINIKLKCGHDLTSASVSKLAWINLYDSAYYNLSLDSLDSVCVMAPTDTNFVFTPATPLMLLTDADSVVSKDFFIFPFDYTRKNQSDQYVYEIPELLVYVAQGIAKLQFLHDMKPQYSYTLTITINSAYVSVDVSAAPWDDIPNQSTDIDDPSKSSSTFTIENWDVKNSQTGTIDDYIK